MGQSVPTETIGAGSVHCVYSADGEVPQSKCFCVSASRRYYLATDDEVQKKEWIRQISNVLCTSTYWRVHPGSCLEGWVWKRSRYFRRWRRRWLVLMPNMLMSYRERIGVPTETIGAGSVH